MTASKTTLMVDRRGTTYRPYPYGLKAGEPTVSVKLSKGESNETTVRALDNKFTRYGWKSKIRSGFARLRIEGVEPLDEEHWDALNDFNTVVNPRFIDLELRGDQLDRIPSRMTQNLVDSYAIVITEDQEFDDEVFKHFADQSRKMGDVEFIFKVDKWSDDEWIEDISRTYNIYDSDMWLYPKGHKVSTVADNMDKCYKFGKHNTWNVSPRLDILHDYEEDR